MITERRNLLLTMPIFGGVSPDAIDFILDSSKISKVKAGSFYFREGEIAESMFVLEQGKVEAFRDWNGTHFTLRELGVGDCFGEMALMDCNLRSASVRAKQDCIAIEISAAQLADVYDNFPEQYTLIQMNIGREVVRRLRDTDKRMLATQVEKESDAAIVD